MGNALDLENRTQALDFIAQGKTDARAPVSLKWGF